MDLSGALPEVREAVDCFAFSQSLLKRGGDAERRFALISMDMALEITLRAYLLSRNVPPEKVGEIKRFTELITQCESKGLQLNSDIKRALFDIHEKRNQIYHGRTVMVPVAADLEAWGESLGRVILMATGVDPFEYFASGQFERASLLPEDLRYISDLERRFRRDAPYVKGLTWWSEVQRDAIEAGEKWDLYVHYRPRWPFFIPTLVLVKGNPYDRKVDVPLLLTLESKAAFLKTEKKVWRVWLGIVSSMGFEKRALERAEDHEGKMLGLVLINPKERGFYSSGRGQCRKAWRWLVVGG